jgi:hypothetical protein
VSATPRLHTHQLDRVSSCILCLLLVLLFGSGAAGASDTDIPRNDRNDQRKIQVLVNDFKERLSIPEDVRVSIVPANPLLVSVEALKEQQRSFLLCLEDGFLDRLNDEDLRAVIAHELGHVWIFTHHPYLQTEQLANQIAMRLVSRESLAEVYGKVWERTGTKGDLARFLGQDDRRVSQSGPVHVGAEATQ